MTTLGNKLRKLRNDKKLSLDELAKATQSSKGYLWELEMGKKRPSADKLVEIAKFYGVPIDYLINENDDNDINTAKRIFTRVSSLNEDEQKEIEKIVETIINMKK